MSSPGLVVNSDCIESEINAINVKIQQADMVTIQLKESKLFLSYVIRDMSNPTLSIKVSLQAALCVVQSMNLVILEQLKF